MPIAKLFVEGSLDVQILVSMLRGRPVVYQGGSKHALRSRARVERYENGVHAAYLRDRDFDFDPPSDEAKPTVDAVDGTPLGWRWCRHEIENYLIDPAIAIEATQWDHAEIVNALCDAASRIRYYQAARWTIGIVRRALPPHYELKTRPDGLNEIDLPRALDSEAVKEWASRNVAMHREPITMATDSTAVQKSFGELRARFSDEFIGNVQDVLLWFSGKDLLAGLADWLASKTIASPGAFRALLRDWMIAHPERTIELLPEWNGLVQVLNA